MPTASSRPSRGPRRSGRSQAVEAARARRHASTSRCIRAGTRSLRAELDHLLLLTTLYGPGRRRGGARRRCLAQAIVGSHHVEQWLRLQEAGPVAPAAAHARGSPTPRAAGAAQPAALRCPAARRRSGGRPMATPTLEEKAHAAPAHERPREPRRVGGAPPGGGHAASARSSRPSSTRSSPGGASRRWRRESRPRSSSRSRRSTPSTSSTTRRPGSSAAAT